LSTHLRLGLPSCLFPSGIPTPKAYIKNYYTLVLSWCYTALCMQETACDLPSVCVCVCVCVHRVIVMLSPWKHIVFTYLHRWQP
jgi:hypothetical protein